MIEKALKAKLESIPALAGTVKVYPLTAPKGAPTPYLVYTRTSTERIPTLTSQGMHKVNFQLTIAEKSYNKMVELRAAVRDNLEFQSGVFKQGTAEIMNTIIVNENEYFEPEFKEYVGIIDIQLIYNAVPYFVDLFTTIETSSIPICSTNTKASETRKLTAGSTVVANQIAQMINYGAVGTGSAPPYGSIGLPDEVIRLPVKSIDVAHNSATESTINVVSYYDERHANNSKLSSIAVLINGFDYPGTGQIVASKAVQFDKTSLKTLTASAQIKVIEV